MSLKKMHSFWQIVSLASIIILMASFFLLFYSLWRIYGCVGEDIVKGTCSESGLRAAAIYNKVLVALIFMSTAGIIVGIIKADRIQKQIDALGTEDDEDEPVEGVAERTDLPEVRDDERNR
jgi:hypothetical protein